MNPPSAQWFYAKDGNQAGPIPQHELSSLLASGAIPADTPVWCEGMEEWTAADRVGNLIPPTGPLQQELEAAPVDLEASVSPYAPPTSDSSEFPMAPVATSGPQIRPWIRFWARTVDLLLIGFCTGIVLAFVAPEALEIPDFLWNIIVLAFAIFVQAASFALVGTTPGKAMFRVAVRHADGSKLGFPAALAREAKVFLTGLGLGIPLLALIFQIISYSKLKSEGITSWDRSGDLVVSHQTVGIWRWLLMVGMIGSFVALAAYGSTA